MSSDEDIGALFGYLTKHFVNAFNNTAKALENKALENHSATTVIGTDIQTNNPVAIGGMERRSGLYILGKPGMGKSTLLVNMMIQDIVHTYNTVFFSILMAMRYGIFFQITPCVR